MTYRPALLLLAGLAAAWLGWPARPAPAPPRVAPDTTLDAARAALEAGRPWRASRLLVPVLRDSTRATPEARLLGAAAAAAWGGWRETERLLRDAPWLDQLHEGEGRELLARAALAQGKDSLALAQAGLASRVARRPQQVGERTVLLARAWGRVGAPDSAAAAWLRAADRLPPIADWLRVRAVATLRDSAAREQVAALVADSLARRRLPQAVAAALELAGDTGHAIRAWSAAGADLPALRLRAAAGDTGVGAALMAFIRARSGSGAAREAVALLDSLRLPLAPTAQLDVARSAARSGPLGRAADGFAAAIRGGLATGAVRFDYGSVLARLGRHGDAVAQFRLVRQPTPLAALARFRAGRSLVRDGQTDAGIAELRRVVRGWPADTAAALARYLLADLATDRRQDSAARAGFREVVRRFPRSHLAPASLFRAAIIAYADGAHRAAARELDSLVRRWPAGDEVLAALYWSGRAWHEAGDSVAAQERWRAVLARDPASYYAEAAARRLGEVPWRPPAAADSFVAIPGLDSGAARADLLEHLGLDPEASLERARVTAAAAASPESLLAAAELFRRRGLPARGIALARRALDAGAPRDARTYRLLYPVAFADALAAEALERRLDPALVAALIRQESLFDPAATSAAGARGLMQVMPEVGRRIARSLGYAVWDPVLLWQPDVSLELGSIHLRELLDGQRSLVEVLASYNAGANRVVRWKGKNGAEDPEVLVERIPFVETRDYVRIVQRNRALYRALYAWPEVMPTAP